MTIAYAAEFRVPTDLRSDGEIDSFKAWDASDNPRGSTRRSHRVRCLGAGTFGGPSTSSAIDHALRRGVPLGKIIAVSVLTCAAAVTAVCGGDPSVAIPSWARPNDAQVTHALGCNDAKFHCSIEYGTNMPSEAVLGDLTQRLEQRGWSVTLSDAGLGATQLLRAEPPDAKTCLYYSLMRNVDFHQPTPSIEPGVDFRADEQRLRSQYSLFVEVSARTCYLAEE